jgi:hypothetical protein
MLVAQSAKPIIFWLALTFALSPALLSLSVEAPVQPFAGSLLIAPLLLTRLWILGDRGIEGVADDGKQQHYPRLGASLVALGMLIELLGVAADAWSVAHFSIPVAVVGMSTLTGLVSPRHAVASFWCIPIPISLYVLTTPVAETWAARLAGFPLQGWLEGFQVSGPLIRYGERVLQLRVVDSGLHMAWLLALIAWYGALRLRWEPARIVWLAVALLPCAFLLEVVTIQIGILLLISLGAEPAGQWIKTGGWLVVAVLGIAIVEGHAATTRPDVPNAH